MTLPKQVKIVEVSPRDGLQNETTKIPTELKLQLIHALTQSGLQDIEITSYVSPKWVPQLADHHQIAQSLNLNSNTRYIALVPNQQGLDSALKDGVKHIAVFTAASDSFSKKNTNSTIATSLRELDSVITKAKAKGMTVRGYVSCVMSCPYEGVTQPEKVADITKALFDMGCHEISLGDTIGVGTPIQSKHLLEAVTKKVPIKHLAVHFHDTYGQALANIYSALEEGISIIDSSAAGLGGCPYAPGAGGNVATEDVLFLCQGLGIQTGVDLAALTHAGKVITDYLGTTPRSRAALALQSAKC